MAEPTSEATPTSSRRDFLTTTGAVAAGNTLAGLHVPLVHAAENNTINVALVGAGGRGTGAAALASVAFRSISFLSATASCVSAVAFLSTGATRPPSM